MLRNVLSRIFLFAFVCASFASHAVAVPLVLSHQGRLLDASDAPMNGVFTIVYSIHDAEVGGTQLWMEDHVGVVVTDGLFSVQLGSSVPLTSDILTGHGGGGGGGLLRYLQVQISGQPPIMPRTQLVAAPYAVASHSVSGDIETFPSGFKTRCPGCNDPWRGDISAASSVGADSINVIRLNGLPPGTPVTGRVAVAVTGDISSIALGDIDSDGQLDMRCGPDSTVFDLSASEGGSLVSSYRAKAGKTGATKRMMHSSGGFVSAMVEDCNDAAEMRMSSMGVGGDVSSSSIYCDPDSIVLLEQISDGRAVVQQYRAKAGQTGKAKQSLFVVPGGGTVAETEDCDDGGTERSLQVSNIGSSAQENGTLDRITADSILTDQTVVSGGTLMSSYTAKQGSTGRTKRTAAFTLDGSRSQDDEVVSAVNGVRRKLETHNLGSSGQDGVSDLRCTPDSIVAENTITEGSELRTLTYSAKQGKTGSASGKRTINPNGGSSETEEVCDTAGASLKLTIDSTPARISTNFTVGKQSSRIRLDSDSDGDTVPESEIDQIVTPTTAGVAIKTKGTGADPNRVLSIQNGATPDALSSVSSIDDDGDTVPESEISQSVTPTTCGVAIKTKGTGADPNRVVSSQTGTTPFEVSGSMSIDDDGDTVPESEISQSVTPTTCGVAIKTKGTGADPNRVIGATDDTTATMLMATDSASISMKVRKGGMVNGSITVNNGSLLRMVEIGSDGNGYFASGVGVGVDPTHHIDVVGGAYCDGTNWVNASDKNSKENFEQVNGEEILEKISDLEITKWNYKGDDDAQHIGPTAQDFKKTFGVGADDKSISTIDPSGIALAAIKELYKQFSDEMKQKDAQIEELQKEMKKLRKELEQKKN